ncbi:hypothetical protein PM082_004359 [Marasmius tenuissimus]|nr:hypothetical protein PM082_004359 [Marasmius tenuissimus]
MSTHEDLDFYSTSPDTNWSLLTCLPYCPSKEAIAREHQYLFNVDSLPFGEEEDEPEAEAFCLVDSDFGKIPTTITHQNRTRDHQAKLVNSLFLHRLPFFGEDDGEMAGYSRNLELGEETKCWVNFAAIHVRNWVRGSTQKRVKFKKFAIRLVELPRELIEEANERPSGSPMVIHGSLQILSAAHPVDPDALRRVNKFLRDFLSSSASGHVWKSSFASATDPAVPVCPVDMNGSEWARLLFGPQKCDDCDERSDSVRPNVVIRKRLCKLCLRSRIRPPVDVRVHYYLILQTFDHCGPPTARYTVPDHFVRADFETVMKECARLETDIENGVDGAKSAMKEYRRTQGTYVAKQLKHAREVNAWFIDIHRRSMSEKERKIDNQLARELINVFVEKDLQGLTWRKSSIGKKCGTSIAQSLKLASGNDE